MKKVFYILIVLIISMSGLFASYNRIGFESGAEFYWSETKLGTDDLSVGGYSMVVPIAIEGANFFGSDAKFGVGYGFAVTAPIYSEQGDHSLSSLSAGIRPSITARYRQPINSMLTMEAGVGYMFEYRSTPVTVASVDYGIVSTYSNFMIADASFAFRLDDWVSLVASAEMSVPLYIHKDVEKGPYASSGMYNQSGFAISPRIAVMRMY
ncbi:MAG: hypothetical protein J6R23_05010 [Spirochaetales bacterium]|nr:hypothetical protein [Spirochaetales bacterium]